MQPAAPEAASGMAPWKAARLPDPPTPRGLKWIGVVGPGVITLGAALGIGERLLGPAAFVKYGFALLWVTLAAAFFQTVFNTELMRYTVATGEPVMTGFLRTKPRPGVWAVIYVGLLVLQVGWPAWAGMAAGAIFFVASGELPAEADQGAIAWIGTAGFLAAAALLLVGRRIERTLELLNWGMVAIALLAFLLLAVTLARGTTWLAALAGFAGFDLDAGAFRFIPEDADFVLLGAVAGYSGLGGIGNLMLSNWARDKGYGMAAHAGWIPAAVGGRRVPLAHSGFRLDPNPAELERFRGWWRIVRVDQGGIYFTGALLGMALPAVVYATFLARGSEIRGLGVAAELARALGEQVAPWLGTAVALLVGWILWKTQLDLLEGSTRLLTDLAWTSSARVRAWRGGDVRAVYYLAMGVFVLWGVASLRLAQPLFLLQLGANVAGGIFVISALHLLWLNTRLLPRELRPPLWRRLTLIAMALFYAAFAGLSLLA
jgi:hypothetical protein